GSSSSDTRAKPQPDARKCYRCGGDSHLAKDCRFANEKCHNCGKVGHIKRACRTKTGQKERPYKVKGGRNKFECWITLEKKQVPVYEEGSDILRSSGGQYRDASTAGEDESCEGGANTHLSD
uniref:CCHC-type domain-containing protein n=1 Tax=Sander lucioperca TaxID=283035 RepID=A0A8C9Z4H5_SANLU